MKTDEATSEESFDEKKMGRVKNIFDTPTKKYLDMKKDFLKNAPRRKFWGANKSKQRVVAVNEMLEYCKKSIKLTDECGDRELTHKVLEDIYNLVVQVETLPIPGSVRKKINNFVEGEEQEEFDCEFDCEFDMMNERYEFISMLEEMCAKALEKYERKEWASVEKFNEDSFQLRFVRKSIYQG